MLRLVIYIIFTISLFANDLLLQIDKNLQPTNAEIYKKIINIEPDGSKKEFLLYQAKSGNDKMVSCFLKPESEKGRSILRLGDNMWLYIPSVGRPIRITSLQSVIGGVFNNSDIMRVDFSSEYVIEKKQLQNDVYILTLKAKNDTVAYDKLIMSVDKKTLTPIKIECYSSTGMLIKTLLYKNMKDFGNKIVRPSVIETISPLYKNYKSIMIYGKITPKQFAAEVFTLDNINKVNDLRR